MLTQRRSLCTKLSNAGGERESVSSFVSREVEGGASASLAARDFFCRAERRRACQSVGVVAVVVARVGVVVGAVVHATIRNPSRVM